MISQREVDPAELEREEDCDEEPAIRMNISITIVEEADCCKDYVGTTTRIVVKKNCYEFNADKTTTSGYSMVEDDAKVKQGLLESLPGVPEFATVSEETDSMLVRPIGLASSQGTFQPPTLCQDCVLEVASQSLSFRNMTPTSLLARWGRGIIGGEKTTRSTAGIKWSPKPEVTGLQAEPRCSQHTGGTD